MPFRKFICQPSYKLNEYDHSVFYLKFITFDKWTMFTLLIAVNEYTNGWNIEKATHYIALRNSKQHVELLNDDHRSL